MSWNADEARTIGRIEQKLDTFSKTCTALAERVSTTESFMLRVKGVFAFLSVVGVIAAAFLLSGCVTAFTQCDYKVAVDANGAPVSTLEEAVGWSSVLGKGDIDNLVTTCKTVLHESIDTGLDAGTLAAVEALAKIAPTAAAASALQDVNKALEEKTVLEKIGDVVIP
jgi:hypothetical protein